jgi:DDE superfamily endonuclease
MPMKKPRGGELTL